MHIELVSGKKIYFASDFHLGVPDHDSSLERERAVVSWLNSIAVDASDIFLLGDVFDFWFEYKRVVTKGHIRILGKLAELSDKGINIHFFTGNHDMWTFGYLEKEIGLKLYRDPVSMTLGDKKFHIGHGDGLGPNDKSYKFMKRIFSSPFFQWLFARFHPNFAVGIANFWSKKSRIANSDGDVIYLGEDKENIIIHIKEIQKSTPHDFYVFGHRHLTLDMEIEDSRYINLGEWVNKKSYAVYDGETLKLESYTS